MTDLNSSLLDRAREIAAGVFAPAAAQTDQADLVPRAHLDLLAEAGLLGLAIPARYGGHEAPGPVFREYLAILAAACGATTFVQMQHVSAGGLVAAGENESLKRSLLPRLASGERRCSLAFSHIRRPGPPMVSAAPDGDGWRFDGEAPWLTGWGLMNEVVLAGTAPDGRYVYVVAPLDEGDCIQASAPLRLCAMNATATVTVTCSGLRVGPERWVKTVTPTQQAETDRLAALTPTGLSLGVACAAAGLVREQSQRRSSEALAATASALEAEIDAARQQIDARAESLAEAESGEEAMRLRAWAIEIGVRAAYSAVVASGGAANRLDHPAQRLYREAMVYTLLAQTRDVQAATLARLGRG